MKTKKAETNVALAQWVQAEYEKRKTRKLPFELQWQLNIDYVCGKQNNYISKFDSIVTKGKQYWWQEKEIFNHISPMVDARLVKLAENRPSLRVLPVTDKKDDIGKADFCKKIVNCALQKVNMQKLVENANVWSEITGTCFYKVFWDDTLGRMCGQVDGSDVYQGDVSVMVASPFEIYPDNLTASDINDCRSIIHAKPYDINLIKEIWGADVEGQEFDLYDFSGSWGKTGKSTAVNSALVIEYYEKPTAKYPNGRLLIVSTNKLLFSGELPYINESGDKRGFPFVKQISEQIPACFFGRSVVERAIPVQRAYNSIKNRKTEFLSRLACGVLSVEDGSIDLESLENDGLAPGKVIVYRQGTQPPKFLDSGELPKELEREEERLLKEFASVTGSSGFLNTANSDNTSGVALQILVEQDNKRMTRAISSVMRAYETVARHILRLYKQFSNLERLEKFKVGKDVELLYWSNKDIVTDEVTAESVQDLADTPSGKRQIILELIKAGLFNNESGKLSATAQEKILRTIGMEEFI